MSVAAQDAGFEPLRPIPPEEPPSSFRSLWMARTDLLSFWTKKAYRMQFFGRKFVNRWVFIANSPDTVEHVFVTRHDNYQRKSPYMRKALKPLIGDGLFISEGAKWRSRRALEGPAFHTSHLDRFGEVMRECAEEVEARWAQENLDRQFHVLPDMAALTARIIGRCMFGDAMDSARSESMVADFTRYQAAIEKFDFSSFFGLPEWWPKMPHGRRTTRAAEGIQTLVDELILRRFNEGTDDGTLLSMLLRATDPESGTGLTLEQVRNEAIVIFMAGHETTANSLAWTWYLLSLHPQAQQKFHEELKTVLNGRAPSYADVPALKFTRAIFEEAMRLYPPIPALSRQAIGDDEIRKRTVPAGSIMLVVPWLLHRHERLWEKPHQFIPERFMPGAPKIHRYAYLPFSAGPRVCLGKMFGLTEAIICLAVLGQRFTLSMVPGFKYGYDCRLALRPSGGLPMILNSRH